MSPHCNHCLWLGALCGSVILVAVVFVGVTLSLKLFERMRRGKREQIRSPHVHQLFTEAQRDSRH